MGYCENISNSISLYVDNEMKPAERKKFEEHIDGCAKCREYFEDYSRLERVMTQFRRDAAPDGVHDETMQAVRRVASQTPLDEDNIKKRAPFAFYARNAALAACGVFAAFLAVGAGISIFLFSAGLGNETGFSGSGEAVKYDLAEPSENAPVSSADYGNEYVSGSADGAEMSVPEISAPEVSAQGEFALGKTVPDMSAEDNIMFAAPEESVRQADVEMSLTNEDISSLYVTESSVKSYEISIASDDARRAVDIVNVMEGYNSSERISFDDDAFTAWITRRVPAAKFRGVMDVLRGVGVVIYENESETRTVGEIMDAKASLSAKTDEIARLTELLSESSSGYALAVLAERLSQAESERDEILSRLERYLDEAETPAVYITITQNGGIDPVSNSLASRMKDSFLKSVKICRAFLEKTVEIAAALILPAAIITAGVFVAFAIRRLKKRSERDEK
ncbi:MAG: DUF4349 domain-containing protein [Clostridiales bacterium]|jgi:Zn-finger nucleic acid-binding protein|nr:DUF4349 domain-containing protein [Clostridiales bacterium]